MTSRAWPARAGRMTDRATPKSSERSRSAGRRSPDWSSPLAMRAARLFLTSLCSGSYMGRTMWYVTEWVVRTIANEPGLDVTALAPELLVGLIERAARPDFGRFEAQLLTSGNCARPVRLKGKAETCDGHGRKRVWSPDTEPDGVLGQACGNRREAVCPPCAERYRQDAYHLIAAGLRGGKGVPDTITDHPAVFLTLTAPSFGVVHTRPLSPDGRPRRCRPRRDDPVCPHGKSLSCRAIHAEDDPCLGEPLCAECFDYTAAVTWNNTLGELWRYTTIYVP